MKMLFVGVFSPNSTNVYQAQAFTDIGWQVAKYDYREELKRVGNIQVRDKNLCGLIRAWKPELTVFSKCNIMSTTPILEANKYGRTCLWYMDPLVPNFNHELIQKIKECSFSCFGLWAPLEEAKKYSDQCYFIEQCYDPKMHYFMPSLIPKYDVTFIGGLAPEGGAHTERLEYYNKIRFHHSNNAYGLEHSKLVCQSRININFTETDRGGTSVRLHKILASKGFCLTQSWKNMEKSFTPEVDFGLFYNPEDLKSQIEYYLKNLDLRLEIADNGHRTVQSYSPKNWARKIEEICLIGNPQK